MNIMDRNITEKVDELLAAARAICNPEVREDPISLSAAFQRLKQAVEAVSE